MNFIKSLKQTECPDDQEQEHRHRTAKIETTRAIVTSWRLPLLPLMGKDLESGSSVKVG